MDTLTKKKDDGQKSAFRRFITRNKKESGVGLIELSMGLTIMAIIAAGVFLYAQNAQSARKTNDVLNQVAAIQTGVGALFNGQATYSGLTTAIISDSEVLPAKMIGAGSTIKHAFNGDITITPDAANETYTVQASDIPLDPCQRLVTMDFGRGLIGMFTSDDATVITGRSMTPAEAAAACTSTAVDISWQFF
jgi:major structural subunit of bundle-forming pilus